MHHMPNFRYKATNSTGKMMNGIIEAESADEAQRRLSERGLRPVRVQPAILPKPRTFSFAPAEKSSRGVWVALVVLLVTGAAAALWWYDPMHWFGR